MVGSFLDLGMFFSRAIQRGHPEPIGIAGRVAWGAQHEGKAPWRDRPPRLTYTPISFPRAWRKLAKQATNTRVAYLVDDVKGKTAHDRSRFERLSAGTEEKFVTGRG